MMSSEEGIPIYSVSRKEENPIEDRKVLCNIDLPRDHNASLNSDNDRITLDSDSGNGVTLVSDNGNGITLYACNNKCDHKLEFHVILETTNPTSSTGDILVSLDPGKIFTYQQCLPTCSTTVENNDQPGPSDEPALSFHERKKKYDYNGPCLSDEVEEKKRMKAKKTAEWRQKQRNEKVGSTIEETIDQPGPSNKPTVPIKSRKKKYNYNGPPLSDEEEEEKRNKAKITSEWRAKNCNKGSFQKKYIEGKLEREMTMTSINLTIKPSLSFVESSLNLNDPNVDKKEVFQESELLKQQRQKLNDQLKMCVKEICERNPLKRDECMLGIEEMKESDQLAIKEENEKLKKEKEEIEKEKIIMKQKCEEEMHIIKRENEDLKQRCDESEREKKDIEEKFKENEQENKNIERKYERQLQKLERENIDLQQKCKEIEQEKIRRITEIIEQNPVKRF